MSHNEIISKIEALREWEALAEEAAAEIESLKDSIKKEMEVRQSSLCTLGTSFLSGLLLTVTFYLQQRKETEFPFCVYNSVLIM